MSKSLGNSLFAADFLTLARPLVVRYYLISAHYRSTIDYHDGSLVEAEAALDRIETFLERVDRRLAGTRYDLTALAQVPDEFAAAMDDDLGIPQALAVLHERVRAGNAALDDGDLGLVSAVRAEVLAMTSVLGINPQESTWARSAGPEAAVLAVLVDRLLEQRQAARAARDFATGDSIRDALAAAGVSIEDTATGSHWSITA
jgi:cysteinyl-tRNA synthetase